MNRKKEEVIGYLSSQSWFPRFMELMNKYQDSEAYKQSILAGNKREHTLLSAFPFKELSEKEKLEWIERHNEFFFWYRGMRGKSTSHKAHGEQEAERATKRKALEWEKRKQKGERVEYQDPTNTAKRNLEAAKLFLAKRKQKKGHRSALKRKDDKSIQK